MEQICRGAPGNFLGRLPRVANALNESCIEAFLPGATIMSPRWGFFECGMRNRRNATRLEDGCGHGPCQIVIKSVLQVSEPHGERNYQTCPNEWNDNPFRD